MRDLIGFALVFLAVGCSVLDVANLGFARAVGGRLKKVGFSAR